ncbi:MAG: MFS transporter [Candidatus Promineifilaceae bacterium]
MVSRITLRNITLLLGSTTTVLVAIIAPALPGMAEAFASLPNADFWVRQTLTMPALFMAMGALFAGQLLDRVGRRPVLIVSLILMGLSGTAGFFLNSLTAIMVSRAILGIAVAGITSGFTTLILDSFKGDELNKFLGYQAAAVGFASMLFLFAVGFLAELGWRPPFLIHLFPFIVLPGVIFFIDEPERDAAGPATGVEKVPFPWRRLAPVYVTTFTGMAIFFIFPAQLPFYLSNEGPSQIGTALALQTVSSVFVALLYQRIKARHSYFAIFGVVFLTLSLNHFIVSLSTTFLVIIAGLIIGGIAPGLFPPNINGWLNSIAPAELRGRAVGLLTSSLLLGQFASPLIAQPFITKFELPTTFAIAGALALGVALVFAAAAYRQKTDLAPAVKDGI